ncbi:hypothetical protein N0V93_007545 [Gnomoniopsis smithogilvyi]|uniref:Uncharacterized protein n=1 Tax=Gnomoniopsis smithogilvyi TaxID=1191159 RepID=A0A9W8YQ84_9PEZI|nr:hypothetical protein N0V93_007545 [Gnomoniopsis smithogilvyi]
MTKDLAALITPTLLTSLVNSRIEAPLTGALDGSEIGRLTFSSGPSSAETNKATWPVLLALSRVGVDALTPAYLATFLPPPERADFPQQCLGMQLLLDQGPRALCKGIDARWRGCYFDVVSRRFAKWTVSLPPALRPDALERWKGEVGASFEYWILVRLWFGAPFVHSELLEDQGYALEYTDETRRALEEVTELQDPWRNRREDTLSDLTGFPRVVMAGPPQGEGVTFADFCWWWFMLMDIHKPIIDRFGRYPYANAARGRESTAEEVKWLAEVDHFAQEAPEVERQVKKDVELGIWQPLGEGKIENP